MHHIFDDVQTSKPQRTAITGGTGRYAGVGGEIVARPAPDDLIDVVFRFRSAGTPNAGGARRNQAGIVGALTSRHHRGTS